MLPWLESGRFGQRLRPAARRAIRPGARPAAPPGAPPALPRERRPVPEPRPVAEHEQHERRHPEHHPERDRGPGRVGFISGLASRAIRRPGRPLPQRGDRSWRRQSRSVVGPRARGRPGRRVGGAEGSSVRRARTGREGRREAPTDRRRRTPDPLRRPPRPPRPLRLRATDAVRASRPPCRRSCCSPPSQRHLLGEA